VRHRFWFFRDSACGTLVLPPRVCPLKFAVDSSGTGQASIPFSELDAAIKTIHDWHGRSRSIRGATPEPFSIPCMLFFRSLLLHTTRVRFLFFENLDLQSALTDKRICIINDRNQLVAKGGRIRSHMGGVCQKTETLPEYGRTTGLLAPRSERTLLTRQSEQPRRLRT